MTCKLKHLPSLLLSTEQTVSQFFPGGLFVSKAFTSSCIGPDDLTASRYSITRSFGGSGKWLNTTLLTWPAHDGAFVVCTRPWLDNLFFSGQTHERRCLCAIRTSVKFSRGVVCKANLLFGRALYIKWAKALSFAFPSRRRKLIWNHILKNSPRWLLKSPCWFAAPRKAYGLLFTQILKIWVSRSRVRRRIWGSGWIERTKRHRKASVSMAHHVSISPTHVENDSFFGCCRRHHLSIAGQSNKGGFG